MTEEIKVSFVRSKTAAETFPIQRKKLTTSTTKGCSPLYLLQEEVRCYFHELSSDNFRMYFKGVFDDVQCEFQYLNVLVNLTEDRDVMVIATNDDVQRFLERSTVSRIFVIQESDVAIGQCLKYIINYI